jgi:hypothetical protein
MSTVSEIRTFNGSGALDGYAGFRVGRIYPLRYQVLEDGDVSIELDHVKLDEGQAPVGPLVMSAAQFKQWFLK